METQGIGTNIVTQIGLVVPDIEKAIDTYVDILGLPRPTVQLTGLYEEAKTNFHGQPSIARAKLAFFDMGQLQIELIEPDGNPSTWQDGLDKNGYSVHHIAFQVKGTDQVVAYLEGKGIPKVQQGHYPGGMYTYMDSTEKLGLVLELLENF